MGKLRVTLVKSVIGCPRTQRVIVRTLGLRKTHSQVFLEDNPAIRGALDKVRHLVKVDVSRQTSDVSHQTSDVKRKKQTNSLTVLTTNDQRHTTFLGPGKIVQLHTLTVNKNARPKRTRKGQGIGSGLGKTAGRGHKGQKARSGGSIRPGFEGGQMPLQRRIPKRGFSNAPFKKQFVTVNLNVLNHFPPLAIITPEILLRERKIKKIGDGVKVLGQGKLEKALVIRLHAFSKSAVEKIKAAGGKTEVI
jgi:large subunit ribosomal protein L15